MYAKEYDIAHQTKPPFQLPYKIEGDKVCGHTVRLRFNAHEKWTKALKYVVCPILLSSALSLLPIFSLRSEKTRRLSIDVTK